MICLIIKLLSVEIFLLLNKNTYIIAIAGGTGSGKTYLVNHLIKNFGNKNLLSIEVDSYYKDLAHLDFKTRAKNNFAIHDGLWILMPCKIHKYIYLQLLFNLAWESRRGSWARVARMRRF